MIIALISIFAAIVLILQGTYTLYRERTPAGAALCLALVVTALLELFDIAALTVHGSGISWKKYSLIAESLLPPLWMLSSLTFARQAGPWKITPLLRICIGLTCLLSLFIFIFPLSSFFYAPDFPEERLLFLGNVGYFYYLGIMVCMVFALVNLEITLTNASPDSLWKIKFDIIGLGTIVAVLIFYYSQALTYRTLNMDYVPIRSFVYIVAVALMFFSQIFRRGKARIEVSRQAAFKSIVLFAVGFYLVMIGVMGEGMQYFGSSFPKTVSISFAFLVGIALLIVLLSERVRREVKVMLHKNFYQNKHDYRTQWLRFTEKLSNSRSGEELLQHILSAYCDIFGIKGASLFLNDAGRGGYYVTAQYEMDPIQDFIAVDNSLISFIRKRAWVINTKEDNPEIMAEDIDFFSKNNISFIVPLFASDGLEGFIALGRSIKQDEVYIYEDYDLMKTIGRQASLAIMHQRLSEQVMQAREIDAIGNVAAFVIHDLKNLVSNLSLIVENAARHIHNPDFQRDMLTSLGNTVVKMQNLIGRLKNLGEGELFNIKHVNLLDLVQKTASMVSGARIHVRGTPETAEINEDEIQKVIVNLLMNGIEASGPDQPVVAEVGYDKTPFIRITDTGCGMPANFIRNELFKPFRTTKRHGLGIGLYQCRQIAEAHGSRIEVSSVEGRGSVFTVWLSETVAMLAESPDNQGSNNG